MSRELAAHPPVKPDTLVVAPYRGLMSEYEPWELMQTNAHIADTYPDTPAGRINRAFLAKLEELKASGIAYDITDERTLEEDGAFENGRVRLGQATYAHLVVDPGAQLRGAAVSWRTEAPPASTLAGVADPSSGPGSASPATTIPLTWRIPSLPDNAWLLEPQRSAPCEFTAVFTTAFAAANQPALTLHFADDLVAASLDGHPLAFSVGDDGCLATLPALGAGECTLRFHTVREVPGRPFVWLKGPFTLLSRSSFTSGPNGTVRTDGPFVAGANPVDPTGELSSGGLPFMHQPLVAEAGFALKTPASALGFAGMQGDAMRVWIDDQPAGWAWGPDWRLTLPRPLNAGPHRLRVELIPSTYNHFGPHHYYNGDWHVVSPGQVVGDRNFADAPGAPERTHVPAWHFKPFRLPERLHT
jgi:hypothetical protein